MKIAPTDYSALQSAVLALVSAHAPELRAHRAAVSEQRFLWDVLHASRFDTHALYSYLNDAHIETALRRIVRDLYREG